MYILFIYTGGELEQQTYRHFERYRKTSASEQPRCRTYSQHPHLEVQINYIAPSLYSIPQKQTVLYLVTLFIFAFIYLFIFSVNYYVQIFYLLFNIFFFHSNLFPNDSTVNFNFFILTQFVNP